jgi:Ca2+-binding RTX toxin-like protein
MPGATENRLDIHGTLGTPGSDPAIGIHGEDTRLSIAKSGFISAVLGVEVDGVSSNIVNRGLVSVDNVGFFLDDSAGRLVNYGHITTASLGTAVSQSAASGKFTVENHGVIGGYVAFQLEAPELVVKLGETSEIHSSIGMLIHSTAGQTAKITNDGLMSNVAGYAYNNIGDGEDVILNRGTIYGDIILHEGDDRFTDKGKFLGELSGGGGNDTFILRRATEIVELAAGGTDTVKIGRSFALDANIENLVALGGKNATLTGNDSANTIKGNAGNNVIAGGVAADILTGGGGKDTFVYAKFDGGDTITDFKQGQDGIRIEGFTQFTSFGDLDIVKSGKDVRISFADENGADFILVENQKVADFDKGDFLFG